VFHELCADMGVAGVSLAELWALEPAAFAPLGRVQRAAVPLQVGVGGAAGGGLGQPPGTAAAAAAAAAGRRPPLLCAAGDPPRVRHAGAAARAAQRRLAVVAEGVYAGPVLRGFRAFTEGMDAGLRGAALGQ
jgi:hypothetical protein